MKAMCRPGIGGDPGLDVRRRSNLHELGIGLHLSTDNYDGYLPPHQLEFADGNRLRWTAPSTGLLRLQASGRQQSGTRMSYV